MSKSKDKNSYDPQVGKQLIAEVNAGNERIKALEEAIKLIQESHPKQG